MDKQLRKRLEEAENNFVGYRYAPNERQEISSVRTSFCSGVELGYNEAIKVAKEWLIKNTETRMPDDEDKDFVWVQGVRYEDRGEFIARFETYMNKLLEE